MTVASESIAEAFLGNEGLERWLISDVLVRELGRL